MIAGKYTDINFIKKNNVLISVISIEDYNNVLFSKCEKTIPTPKKLEKINNDNLCLPTVKNSDILFKYNYNVQQLKQFAKYYKLKVSGNKNELLGRIYVFLKLSKTIVNVQKIFRGFLQRKCNLLHGPAFMNRKLCTNDSDFLTGDTMTELDYSQFFSYKDADGFIYGFDIISLYNLILKSGKQVKNPYNRNDITKTVIQDMRNLIRVSRVLKVNIDIEIKDETLSNEKSVELRTLDLFQNIDSLGNYSDPSWFLLLPRNQMIKFVRELIDIWTYRAQLTSEMKKKICPPFGDPFRNVNFSYLHSEENNENVKKIVLTILEKLVNTGVDNDSRTLGAYYVLGALTLVSENAASSLPWLFQSVSHF
jgi:hypothetical protein